MEAANEAIQASREAAEASKKAAREAGEWWVKVFKELLSDTGEASERAKKIVQQTSEFLQKTPQEIIIESTVDENTAADVPAQPAEADVVENDDAGAEQLPEMTPKDSKTISREMKEKAKDRMDSLTKMFLSGAEEEEE